MRPGYTIEEWRQIRKESTGFQQEAVTTLAPFGGLTSNSLAHLRSSWLSWRDSNVQIRVPQEATCNTFKSSGSGYPNQPPFISKRDKPCSYCRDNGTTDEFENRWSGDKTKSTNTTPTTGYQAILHYELAAPAVSLLRTVFQTHQRTEIAATPSSLQRAAQIVAEEHDTVDRKTYLKLLRTGPVIYANYGLSPRDIAELTPFETRSVKRIVYKTPGVSVSQHDTLTVLKAVNDREPATVNQLSDILDINRSAVHHRLQRLQDEGRVVATNNSPGRPAATWEAVSNWDSKFTCGKCDYQTYSLCGIRTHRAQKH
jgi:biotin operon repressor